MRRWLVPPSHNGSPPMPFAQAPFYVPIVIDGINRKSPARSLPGRAFPWWCAPLRSRRPRTLGLPYPIPSHTLSFGA